MSLNKNSGATMKTAYTLLISLLILGNFEFLYSQTPNLKFTTKFNDIEIIKSGTRSISVGDTLLFIFSDTNIAYLNICFDNKCLKFSNIEMGIKQATHLRLQDAIHVNQNDNILWVATSDGLFMFDGENLVRNTKTLDVPDIPNKGAFAHALYKHSNGDIYISNGYKLDLMKYDGFKYDTIVSPLSDEEIYIKGKSPLTKLVGIGNRLYFRTILADLAYLDFETQEYHYLFLKDTIIKNFLTDEELLPLAKPIIRDLQKYDEVLFLKLHDILRNSFFFYDGNNIEKVELDRDLISPNDSSYQIHNIFIDSKLRKWCYIPTQRTLYEPYDRKDHYFIIDRDYNYFRIELEKYGFQITLFSGLHEFSNGTTYLNINEGFLVDDPLGVSVTESIPSFFMHKVRPNPFKDRAQVEITATRAAIDNMKVEIFDYLGKSIRQIEPFITYQPITGLATLELETDGIRPGYYYLVLTDHNDKRTMPIMIK
jgi:hypothetical protein